MSAPRYVVQVTARELGNFYAKDCGNSAQYWKGPRLADSFETMDAAQPLLRKAQQDFWGLKVAVVEEPES